MFCEGISCAKRDGNTHTRERKLAFNTAHCGEQVLFYTTARAGRLHDDEFLSLTDKYLRRHVSNPTYLSTHCKPVGWEDIGAPAMQAQRPGREGRAHGGSAKGSDEWRVVSGWYRFCADKSSLCVERMARLISAIPTERTVKPMLGQLNEPLGTQH